MNKDTFLTTMAKHANITKDAADHALNAFVATVTEMFEQNESFVVPNFGTLGVKQRPERSGRNPGTGETITIPAAAVPYFKVGNKLKERLNPKTAGKTKAAPAKATLEKKKAGK
jgi:DNA-binding protein HU-beta